MKLSEIIKDLDLPSPTALSADPDILSIHHRAQTVRPKGLFVAIAGLNADGHDFVPQALAGGAAALIVQKPLCAPVPVIRVSDSRTALAAVSSRFYRRPSLDMVLIGVTGTNGKTTTAYLIENILSAAGCRTGLIGTVECRFTRHIFHTPMTTPDPPDLQRILADMRSAGVTHVVMEVSSHGIDMARVAHCWFDIGVLTNISQDHLDYHGDMARYAACKKRWLTRDLFQGPKQNRARAVFNCVDEWGRQWLREMPGRGLGVGTAPPAAVRAVDIVQQIDGIHGRISTPEERFSFHSPLIGAYNLENVMCAAGAAIALGIDTAAIQKGIAATAAVPGRLEPVANSRGLFVFVDYAHTPQALDRVLQTLRAFSPQRLFCVFGCGGDRDRQKRPQMGEIAGRWCDWTILTSDNPRSEDPLTIIAQIQKGIEIYAAPIDAAAAFQPADGTRSYCIEADRRSAIRLAVRSARAGDTVLIAGKGHETVQLTGGDTLPFDDRTEAREALAGGLT